MREIRCPQETAVTKASRAGVLDASLQTHVAGCAVCREVVQVSSWMQGLAPKSELNSAAHDASILWWRARLTEKAINAEMAEDLLEWVEIGFAAAISLGLGAWAAWNWYAILGSATAVLAGAQNHATAYSELIVYAPFVAVVSFAAFLLGYPLLVDE